MLCGYNLVSLLEHRHVIGSVSDFGVTKLDVITNGGCPMCLGLFKVSHDKVMAYAEMHSGENLQSQLCDERRLWELDLVK